VTRSGAWRLVRRLFGGVCAVAGALAVGTATGRYLLRATWEEGKILARRRPIADAIADTATPAALRAKLQLVLDARRYALDSLGLAAGGEFTSVSRTDRDTLVLVLSAAYRDSLAFRGWWFPVVGRVPYKGFFDFAAARRDSVELDADSLDAVLRPASAFSTLGWFDDPVLPTTLAMDSLDLANTVIHELVHTTWYGAGAAVFNESFANFVGFHGATQFFDARAQRAAADVVRRRWREEQVLGVFWAGLYASLDSAFAAHPGDRAARLAAREVLFAAARRRLITDVAPALERVDTARLARLPITTATVLSRRIYRTHLDLFEHMLVRRQGDLRATITDIVAVAKANARRPYSALCATVRGVPLPPAPSDVDPKADIAAPCGPGVTVPRADAPSPAEEPRAQSSPNVNHR
jgi:predicted aminopeptidase